MSWNSTRHSPELGIVAKGMDCGAWKPRSTREADLLDDIVKTVSASCSSNGRLRFPATTRLVGA
jgi:hypothetical protein